MSYEGRVQKLCFRCNYYEEQNCYVETDRCPYCNCEWGKSNDVDDTNGEADGYDHSMVPESCFNTDSIIQSLRTELEETKKQLSEAREVIGFYASRESWLECDGPTPDDYLQIKDDQHGHCGGYRARGFLAKYPDRATGAKE